MAIEMVMMSSVSPRLSIPMTLIYSDPLMPDYESRQWVKRKSILIIHSSIRSFLDFFFFNYIPNFDRAHHGQCDILSTVIFGDWGIH
jgi:hypothetical protein